jgi:tripartite ATP-independent transporter DctM subunit
MDAYKSARDWCGRLPCGLAVNSTVASALFGAICGSAQATGIVMSQLAWPEMKRYGYDPRIGVSSIVAAAPLAILIPPSTPMIVYGMLAQVSVGNLFMGGWIPGIVLTILLSGLIVYQSLRHPERAPRAEKSTLKEKLTSLKAAWPIHALGVVIMFCIWGGITTENESAGLAVICCMLIVFLKRRATDKDMLLCIRECAINAAALFFMFVGIQVFNAFLAMSTLPSKLCNLVVGLKIAPMGIIWVIVILYIILGCFIDSSVITVLTVPIFAPIVAALGFDLVWFGIITFLMIAIGGITPPVGMVLFVTSNRIPTSLSWRHHESDLALCFCCHFCLRYGYVYPRHGALATKLNGMI